MACCAEFPCNDFAVSLPGKPVIRIVPGYKYSIPFRDEIVVTTYMSDYIPPVLLPGYCDRTPRIIKKPSYGCTNGGATKKFLLDYRHENLTNSCCRPKFLYGRRPSNYTPWPDVALAAKVIPWPKLRDTPHVRPITLDKCKDKEIRKFYEDCQAYRDYYLDRTETFYPVPYFNLGDPYSTRCPPDERTFKIRRPQDKYDIPRYLGPPLHCHTMPCIQHHKFLTPFTNIPKLPREPFLCDRKKPKSDIVDEVLLV